MLVDFCTRLARLHPSLITSLDYSIMSQSSFYVPLVTSLLHPGDLPSWQHSIVGSPYARGLIYDFVLWQTEPLMDQGARHTKTAIATVTLDCTERFADQSHREVVPLLQPANTLPWRVLILARCTTLLPGRGGRWSAWTTHVSLLRQSFMLLSLVLLDPTGDWRRARQASGD